MLFLRLRGPLDRSHIILECFDRLLAFLLIMFLWINRVLCLFKPIFQLCLKCGLYCEGLLFNLLFFALNMFVVVHQLWVELLDEETVGIHPSFLIVENAKLVFLWSLVNPIESLQHLFLIPLVNFSKFCFLFFKYSQAPNIILEIEVEIFGVQFGFKVFVFPFEFFQSLYLQLLQIVCLERLCTNGMSLLVVIIYIIVGFRFLSNFIHKRRQKVQFIRTSANNDRFSWYLTLDFTCRLLFLFLSFLLFNQFAGFFLIDLIDVLEVKKLLVRFLHPLILKRFINRDNILCLFCWF